MFGQNKKILNLKRDEDNFWPTFTDLLSTVILVFLLILISFMMVAHMKAQENQRIQESLNERVAELNQNLTKSDQKKSQLDAKVDRLNQTIAENEKIREELDARVRELNRRIAENERAKEKLDTRVQELNQTISENEETKDQLDARVRELNQTIAANYLTRVQLNQEIENLNQIVNDIIGFRKEVAIELRKAFESSGLVVDVDDDGAITFSGDVLFNTDSAQIKPQFKEMLERFIPKYVRVLLDDKYKDNISQIIIEGHTDDDGTYMYNLDLSQRRAYSVARYILSKDFIDYKYKDELKKYLTATGKSESRLKYNDDGSVNKERSRRVEFKFNIKDEILINKMKEVIEGRSGLSGIDNQL